jgi:nitrate reductase gamma subunit
MDIVLFAVFPYVAVATAIAAGWWRYGRSRFSYSSMSSQLLENRALFWGSVPWHYGITLILLAHLIAWLLPGATLFVLGRGVRLAVIETVGLALALYAAVGLGILMVRRLPPVSRASASTSKMDWIVLVFLAVQVVTGLLVALFNRWGSVWYVHAAAPWLWSLLKLQPDVRAVAVLPALVQLHFLVGFLLILLFPMSRLVHIAVPPIGYLWRPYQVVIWRRTPRHHHTISPGMLMATTPPDPRPMSIHTSSPTPPCQAPSSGEPPGRRRFLSQLSIIAGSVAGLIVGLPTVAFLLGLRKTPQVWTPVGSIDDFALGTTKQVAFADPSPLPWAGVTAQTAAWLRRDSPEGFTAFSMNCTHLGCPVRWLPDAELFMCPCHGGVFYRDGRVASGPPPQRLATYPVRVRDGRVEILTSPLPISGR